MNRPVLPKWIPALCLVIGAEVFLCPAVTPAETAGRADRPHEISDKDLSRRIRTYRGDIYYGGLLIAGGESVSGNIVVLSGTLDIQEGGVLDGSAWIVGGQLIVSGAGRVTGRVDLVNGEEYLSRNASVDGGVTVYECECELDTDAFDENDEIRFIKREDPEKVRTRLALGPGYPARVDYNIFRIGLARRNDRNRDPHVRGHAMAHVPMWGKFYSYFGFDAELRVPLFGESADIVGRGYNETFTNDSWQMPRGESALNLFITGYDFPDYFQRRGGQLGIDWRLGEYWRIEPMVTWQKDLSMTTNPSISIWRSGSKERENPPIVEGERIAAAVTFEFDTRGDERAWPKDAWFAQVWAEKGIADGRGEFSYTAFHGFVRWYNRLPFNLQWDMRGRLFSTLDAIPAQITQSLNGFAGVRGLDDQPFDVVRGDRLALFSSEWRYWLPEVPVVRWVFTRWNAMVFTDIGLLAVADNATAPLEFLETPFAEWRKTLGVGVSGESFLPYLGVYVANDLDGRRKDARLIIRINRAF